MNRKRLIGIALALFPCFVRAGPADDLSRFLKKMNFVCEDGSSARAVHCRGLMPEAYDAEFGVHIFFPRRLRVRPRAELALHLHGWNLGESPKRHFEGPNGDFGAWLERSRSGRILIVPESEDKVQTYRARLMTGEGLERLVRGVLALLSGANVISRPEVESILLSAHSGSYVVVAEWAAELKTNAILKKVRALSLYDAVYGAQDKLLIWARHLESRRGRFVDDFAEPGETAAPSRALAAELNVTVSGQPDSRKRLGPGTYFYGWSVGHFDILGDDRVTQHFQW